ncbi:MAG: sulfate permease, SulP family [Alphaproteobacteria bacterium]|jgi:SulP family sulfate permease|nr:sulfate permease, SulP family [Alphaproteobacteria bacterium]
MDSTAQSRSFGPSVAELYTPKLVTILREGYGFRDFGADAVAGLTVAIVALPLSMAIAIASGVSPDRGLYTAIVGGFLISLLGGSRFQIGGPAGAFIVVVAAIVERQGYDGLVFATIIAGGIMILTGVLRLGTYVKYVPYPVTVGFTAGIAIIILASQVKELFGLQLLTEPAALVPKAVALWSAAGTLNPATVTIALLSLLTILLVRHLRPNWPAFLVAVAAGAVATLLLHLDVATVGSRFGGIPNSLPAPHLPAFSLEKLKAALPDGVAIALLGSIESLLSAVVADGMTGRRHRSNCELVAQGIGNIASVLFGGICVTGTIARTATNIRAGARGPIAGILHSIYLLLFIVFAAPIVAYIPLASLSAVLVIVAWNMTEKDEFRSLLKSSRGDAVVLLTTFGLTVFEDLIIAIGAGVVLGALLFMHRMAESVEVGSGPRLIREDEADETSGRTAYDSSAASTRDLMIYRISGAFFFAATARVSQVLERVGELPRVFVLDFSEVPFIDSTAAHALEGFVHKLQRAGTQVCFAGAQPRVRRTLTTFGLDEPSIRYVEDTEAIRHGALNLQR